MIAGNSGSGKTILCSQFVYDGFNKDGMDYVFPLVNPKYSFMLTSELGMDFEKFQRHGKFTFLDFTSFD
jgi:KaiC/GvpD/RAD55 family RecA-like ATPase